MGTKKNMTKSAETTENKKTETGTVHISEIPTPLPSSKELELLQEIRADLSGLVRGIENLRAALDVQQKQAKEREEYMLKILRTLIDAVADEDEDEEDGDDDEDQYVHDLFGRLFGAPIPRRTRPMSAPSRWIAPKYRYPRPENFATLEEAEPEETREIHYHNCNVFTDCSFDDCAIMGTRFPEPDGDCDDNDGDDEYDWSGYDDEDDRVSNLEHDVGEIKAFLDNTADIIKRLGSLYGEEPEHECCCGCHDKDRDEFGDPSVNLFEVTGHTPDPKFGNKKDGEKE